MSTNPFVVACLNDRKAIDGRGLVMDKNEAEVEITRVYVEHGHPYVPLYRLALRAVLFVGVLFAMWYMGVLSSPSSLLRLAVS